MVKKNVSITRLYIRGKNIYKKLFSHIYYKAGAGWLPDGCYVAAKVFWLAVKALLCGCWGF